MELEEEHEAAPMDVEVPDEPSIPTETEEILDLPKLMSLNNSLWTFADSASRTPPAPQSMTYLQFKEGFS